MLTRCSRGFLTIRQTCFQFCLKYVFACFGCVELDFMHVVLLTLTVERHSSDVDLLKNQSNRVTNCGATKQRQCDTDIFWSLGWMILLKPSEYIHYSNCLIQSRMFMFSFVVVQNIKLYNSSSCLPLVICCWFLDSGLTTKHQLNFNYSL